MITIGDSKRIDGGLLVVEALHASAVVVREEYPGVSTYWTMSAHIWEAVADVDPLCKRCRGSGVAPCDHPDCGPFMKEHTCTAGPCSCGGSGRIRPRQ